MPCPCALSAGLSASAWCWSIHLCAVCGIVSVLTYASLVRCFVRLGHLLHELGDGTSWVQPLGAHTGAIHNLVAPIQLEFVIQCL